ncbi:hypothetical protein ACS0TY_017816 [Phlomoides rotata]
MKEKGDEKRAATHRKPPRFLQRHPRRRRRWWRSRPSSARRHSREREPLPHRLHVHIPRVVVGFMKWV